MAALEADLASREWQLEAQLEEARLNVDTLRLALDATFVRASVDGVVGSIGVRPGDHLAPGAPIASIVPSGPLQSIVVYIPERDRAFVQPGMPARVEVDQLPAWEFRALHGRVVRVANEIASERDIRDTLGAGAAVVEPMYRLDVTLEQDAAYEELRHRLHPESLVSVRLALRRRRIITILFEPLHRWLR
jgi:multidrug resistance efflux pump